MPATMIGAPATTPRPLSRMAPAVVLGISVESSILAGRPVLQNLGQDVPAVERPADTGLGTGWAALPQAPITVAVIWPGS